MRLTPRDALLVALGALVYPLAQLGVRLADGRGLLYPHR